MIFLSDRIEVFGGGQMEESKNGLADRLLSGLLSLPF